MSQSPFSFRFSRASLAFAHDLLVTAAAYVAALYLRVGNSLLEFPQYYLSITLAVPVLVLVKLRPLQGQSGQPQLADGG